MKKVIRVVWLLVFALVAAFGGIPKSVFADAVLPPVSGGLYKDPTPASVGIPPETIPTAPNGEKTRNTGSASPDGGVELMSPIPPAIITDPKLDMKVLVLHNPDYDFGNYTMILAYLDILGIPYDTVNTKTTDVTAAMLADGNHGKYYAIFIVFSGQWWGDFTDAERNAVSDYERNFGVRQVSWYTFPDVGNAGMSITGQPTTTLTGTLTAAGQLVFPYLKPDITLVKRAADYAYPGTPAPGADVTPLMTDQNGNVALAIFRPGDGREHMVFTWPHFYPGTIPAFLYSRVLPYGIINWATKGIFLGQRHVYFVPQPDDIFSWGDIWDPDTHTLLTDGEYYRLEPDDLDNILNWMNTLRASTPNAADFKIEMPFNGEGTQYDRQNGSPSGTILTPTLTARAIDLETEFIWLNHTFSHLDLTSVSYNVARNEIDFNNDEAVAIGLTDYVNTTLLTGAYSGLTNANVINAAYDLGIRYLLANASLPEYNNPTPNTGIPHPLNNEILLVPRHANNIFYFATNPEMETDYYNWVYCPNYATSGGTIAPCFTYEESVDAITDQALGNLLDFSVNATMFHMNNLDAYDAPTSTKTLLSDYVESLFGKYNALYADVPILSLRTQEIGDLMWERMAYDASAVSAVWSCGDAITITTTNGARIPVTGITSGGFTETYAGQNISYFTMGDNATVSIPATTSPTTPTAPSNLAVAASGGNNVLTWVTPTLNTGGGAIDVLAFRVYRSTDPNFVPGPATLIADRVSGSTYTDLGATSGGYSYVVTAIADNCWKRESAGARIAPTSVELVDFTTRVIEGGIEVLWETASELDTLGFNLYRSATPEGGWVKLNASLIAGQFPGGVIGGSYAFLDTTASSSGLYYYRLEELALSNGSTFFGPITGGLDASPSATTLYSLHGQSTGPALAQLLVVVTAIAGVLALSKRARVG